MSVKQDSLFCTLPVELIFHIFHYLDAQTIVRSIRLVCKRFYTLIDKYDQFDFKFKSILKSDFHYLCNLISPKNVKSLILSDDDETPGQIEYFLSRFRLKQFIQLRSLTLLKIDDCHLGIILKDIRQLQLVELIITSKEDFSLNNTVSNDLSVAVDLPTLQKFILDIPTFDISQIRWSSTTMIRHLEIYCQTIEGYWNLLHHLPQLQILVIYGMMTNDLNNIIPNVANLRPCSRLSSLTFKYCNINMDIFQSLLSLTPMLKHLYLLRSVDIHDFIFHLSEWNKFVETELPLLTKLEFFLTEFSPVFSPSIDVKELIAPFRTKFWTEIKRWFVICDYTIHPRSLIVYSPSAYDPQFEYSFYSKQILRSASIPTINNVVIMNNIRKLCLDLSQVVPLTTSAQGGLPSTPVFPNVDCLKLQISDTWPLCSLRVLSALVNLTNVTELILEINSVSRYHSNWLQNISLLLKLTGNTHSLTLSNASHYMSLQNEDMEICSIIPKHVKHLTISVSTINQMRLVIQKLKYRSSIKFVYVNTWLYSADMHIEWFQYENGYYSYRLNNYSLSMWFDKIEHTRRQLED